MFYDAAYYLAPDKGAAKAYKLLASAMEETGKVALARFVMRTKQYLAAIRARDGVLVLSTMVYADEVNEPLEIPELDDVTTVEVNERERRMAEQLIESLSAAFKPDQYHDTHREQVLDLIERKAAGEEIIAAPAAPAAEKVVDLMAALEASVAAAKESRKRHPTNRSSDEVAAESRRPSRRPSPSARPPASASRPEPRWPMADEPRRPPSSSTVNGSSCRTWTRSSIPRAGSPRAR